jgi:cyanate lyase
VESEILTQEELVERIAKSMLEMEGEELATLYNEQFGDGIVYVGDSMFEQDGNEDD